MMDREAYSALLDRAKHEFSAVFAGRRPVPLAVGLDAVLAVAWPDLSKTRISRFLSCYCGSRPYKLAIAAGGPRHYLDGSADGEVSEAEQESARAWLAARQARNLEAFQATLDRLKQERKARREAAFKKGLADEAAKEERRPAPSPAPLGAAFAQPIARPVLKLRRLEVNGPDRKVREVQVVTRRKFARQIIEGARQDFSKK
jgi:sRNA-binding protein